MHALRRLAIPSTLLLTVLGGLALPVQARGPLHVERFDPPRSLAAGSELRISGKHDGPEPVTLVVRIDDADSSNYATRASPERRIPPGPFTLRVPLTGLKTPIGRILNSAALERIIVFSVPESPDLRVEQAEIVPPPRLPAGAIGWDLGPEDGLLYPGFRLLGPNDDALQGAQVHVVRRPGSDPLLSDGLVGVRRLVLPVPAGTWRVTLWTEDPGEWEAIPHPLQRRIVLNGDVVHDARHTPEGWIASRYLAGRTSEAVLDGNPWQLHGARRGGRVSAKTRVDAQGLVIELGGDGFRATHLAAVLVEPSGSTQALESILTDRRTRFLETWRASPLERTETPGIALRRIVFRQTFAPYAPSVVEGEPVVSVPGGRVLLDLVAQSDEQRQASWALEPPTADGVALGASVRVGHWRYRRAGGASTLLVPDAQHLRGDLDHARLDPRLPRRLLVEVAVPGDTPAGQYMGWLEMRTTEGNVRQALRVEVLDTALPDPGVPVGVYHAEAPHLTWFPSLASSRTAQAACDLDRLRALGLTSLAPPLATPTGNGRERFVDGLEQLRRTGFNAPLLDYASVKRLSAAHGVDGASEVLGSTHDLIASRELAAPLWAVVDEPGIDPGVLKHQARLASALRSAAPAARLAAQLNNPRQADLVPLYDVVLTNPGFGVDAADLAQIRKRGAEPWFYNMPDHRLAAGFYLWRVGAGGYLQWHARMPSADPFDPTDGREDDYQFLYPEASICSAVQDIDARLLALAEGITDLRWLRWLEVRAATEPRATALLNELRAAVAPIWEDAMRDTDPDRLRQRITDLARKLIATQAMQARREP
jgi:hypothetical protein